MTLPSRKTSTVQSIITYDGEKDYAYPPQAVTVTLEDEIDISRGDMIVSNDDKPDLEYSYKAQLIALTDHGNMFGAFKFVAEAEKAGVKPIIGCEFYLVQDRHIKSFSKSKGGLFPGHFTPT